MSDAHAVELRGMIPREVADVLDAISVARRMSRIELATEVLAHYAKEQVHVARVLVAVTGANPCRSDVDRKPFP